jgi:hypothetical protein
MSIWMSWSSRGHTSVFTHLLLLETVVVDREASAEHSGFWMSISLLRAELQMIRQQPRTLH